MRGSDVGLHRVIDIGGLVGPWMKQRVTADFFGWSPDCPEMPSYECRLTMEEAWRVIKDDGSPAGQGEEGGIPEGPHGVHGPRGGTGPRAGQTPPVIRGGVTTASSSGGDTHRATVSRKRAAERGCPICRLMVVVDSQIIDECTESTLSSTLPAPTRGGRQRGPRRVDYVLLKYSKIGDDCMCPYDRVDWSSPLAAAFTCRGKVSGYGYSETWDICPCRREPADPYPMPIPSLGGEPPPPMRDPTLPSTWPSPTTSRPVPVPDIGLLDH